jgi:hypothetical protein
MLGLEIRLDHVALRAQPLLVLVDGLFNGRHGTLSFSGGAFVIVGCSHTHPRKRLLNPLDGPDL